MAKGPGSAAVATTVPSPAPAEKPMPADVDGVDARILMDEGALVVDVRSKAAFDEERIKGAVSVPLPGLSKKAATWAKDRVIIVYDQSGAQGQTAQSWLERNGFTRVYHLYRGVEGWDDRLVGDAPRAFPIRQPVLYYLYVGEGPLATVSDMLRFGPVTAVTDHFVSHVKSEFASRFELRKLNVSSTSGWNEYQEFADEQVAEHGAMIMPSFRLVDESGHHEMTGYIIDYVGVRAKLKRAIERYEAEE